MRVNRVLLLPLVFLLLSACAGKHSKLSPGERKGAELESLLFDVEQHIRKLEVDKAKGLLDEARPILRDPVLRDYPDQSLLWERFNQAQTDLEVAKIEREKRDLELASNAQRQKLEKVVGRLVKANEALERKAVEDSQVSEVKDSLEEVLEELEDGKAMEARSTAYADEAKHARRVVERSGEPLALAKLRVAFRQGPVRTLEEAKELSEEAQKESDPAKKKELIARAKQTFSSCAEEGRKQLAASPALATAAVLDQPKAHTASAVVAACDSGVESAGKKVKKSKAPAAPKPLKKKPSRKKK